MTLYQGAEVWPKCDGYKEDADGGMTAASMTADFHQGENGCGLVSTTVGPSCEPMLFPRKTVLCCNSHASSVWTIGASCSKPRLRAQRRWPWSRSQRPILGRVGQCTQFLMTGIASSGPTGRLKNLASGGRLAPATRRCRRRKSGWQGCADCRVPAAVRCFCFR